MSDLMVDRLDDHEPVTITEALEIPQPRAVGSPLPRGNGNRVSVPPTYADLEERAPLSHPGPVLAPPPAPFQPSGPVLPSSNGAAPAAVLVPEATPLTVSFASDSRPVHAYSSEASVQKAAIPAQRDLANPIQSLPVPSPEAATQMQSKAAPERPRTLQTRHQESPSTLQRAAGVIRHAIPIVQKLLPLMDGNFGTAISNLLNQPPPRPAPSTALVAPPPAPPKIDLTPLKESVAELQTMHKELVTVQEGIRGQLSEQNTSLKKVEDHLELVREATDRNTLEQQELMEDLKSMGSKVNLVAAIAIGLLAISLLVNLALFMHIQRVLP